MEEGGGGKKRLVTWFLDSQSGLSWTPLLSQSSLGVSYSLGNSHPRSGLGLGL